MTNESLKTRFAPSPTGHLHVGGARTALFSYLIARKRGGRFVLRIEDTDRARHQEDAVEKIVDDLRWLGIEWDEGVEVGGPDGPYRQSERVSLYATHVDRLLEQGKAYYAFETPEELDALRGEASQRKENFRYPRPDPLPTDADLQRAQAEGRPVVVRFLCPGHDVTVRDEVFGAVTVPADQQDDFIIRKADGYPTYHLANVVDDALMGITFILRGQEFLGQTWRHALLREALGFPEPGYAHLPLIMDIQGRKLSKRDGAVEVHAFRREGYLPEALISFLALLGWNPGTEQERFTLDELVEAFDVSRIGKSNAKFDRDKLLAFNTDAVSAASPERLLAGLKDYLSLNDTPIPAGDDELLRRVLELCAGFRTFADIPAKVGVLFADDESIEYDDKAVRKVLRKNDDQGFDVLADLREPLGTVDWSAEAIETFLREYAGRNNLGMGKVAQPLRVAVTGSTVSPAIGETLELLGRDKTLARIERCLQQR